MSKSKYLVGIREVYIRTVEVTADNRAEACSKAKDKVNGDSIDLEYSHTMDTYHWSVEEEELEYPYTTLCCNEVIESEDDLCRCEAES